MCLYPKLIINPKYKGNKKNGYKPPILKDERVKYVPIACGYCIECRKKKANEWKFRLQQENKTNKGQFITLTFSDESFEKLIETNAGSMEPDEICKIAIRRFLERWRKKYKRSVKHWFINELGENTNRLHLHGILYTNESKETIEKIWQYGYIYTGYCNEKTISYITKYLLKFDAKHPEFKPKIFTSAGLGKGYINESNIIIHKYRGEKTIEKIAEIGKRFSLPIYYRNHFFSEEEREKLWIQKIEKCERWILGTKYPIKTDEDFTIYYKSLEAAQRYNEELGYKNYGEEWRKEYYQSMVQAVREKK